MAAGLAAGCLPWTVPTQRAVSFLGGPLTGTYGIALTASGPAEVALLPLPRLSLGGVRLAPAADADAPLADGGTLRLQFNLFALLTGRIEVNTASLEGGTVTLPSRDADPRWDGPRAQTARLLEPGAAHPRRLTLSRVTMTGRDPRDGRAQTARDVDLTVSWPIWSPDVDVAGAFRWNDVPTRFTVSGVRVADLAKGARTPFAATADWSAGSLSVEGDGAFTETEGVALAGSASLQTRSLPETLGWMGGDMALSPVIEAFALAGSFEVRDRTLLLPSVRLQLGGDRFVGAGSVSLTGVRPAIQATLAADSLNLAPLLAETLRMFGLDGAGAQGPGARSLALRSLTGGDLDLRLSAGRARMGPFAFDDVAASLLVRQGGIEAALSRATLQGGFVKGRLGLTPGADDPDRTEVRLQGAFDRLDLGALLVDLGQDRWVFGAARGQFAIEGAGSTPDALVRHLDGRATLAIDGGALAGIDLSDVVHRNGAVATGALARRNGRTVFEHAGLTLRVVDGVGQIVDGTLRTPAVTGTLSGSVVLPERRFEARAHLLPRAAADGTVRPGPSYAIAGPWDAVVVRRAGPDEGDGGLAATGALRPRGSGGKSDLPAGARAYAP